MRMRCCQNALTRRGKSETHEREHDDERRKRAKREQPRERKAIAFECARREEGKHAKNAQRDAGEEE